MKVNPVFLCEEEVGFIHLHFKMFLRSVLAPLNKVCRKCLGRLKDNSFDRDRKTSSQTIRHVVNKPIA